MHDLSHGAISTSIIEEKDAIIEQLCLALMEAHAYVQLSHDNLAHTNAQGLPGQALNKIDEALSRVGRRVITTSHQKLGTIRRDDSKGHRPQDIYTRKGWVRFCCDYCSKQCGDSSRFDFCPKCGADNTIDWGELIR